LGAFGSPKRSTLQGAKESKIVGDEPRRRYKENALGATVASKNAKKERKQSCQVCSPWKIRLDRFE